MRRIVEREREKLRTVSWSEESRSRVSADYAQINRVPRDPTGRSMVWHVQSIGVPEATSRMHSLLPACLTACCKIDEIEWTPSGKKKYLLFERNVRYRRKRRCHHDVSIAWNSNSLHARLTRNLVRFSSSIILDTLHIYSFHCQIMSGVFSDLKSSRKKWQN